MSAKILLASASPRRKSLLEGACFEVIVQPSHADETWPGGPLTDGVIALARRKLACLKDSQINDAAMPRLAADTIVYASPVGGDRAVVAGLLGKPRDRNDAVQTLQRLSGREHSVVTGFVVTQGGREHAQAVETRVVFRTLSLAEIERYVATGEPMDKAGAYGIQGEGGFLVEALYGSYTNVVGLPLAEVLAALRQVAGAP